MRGSGDRMSRGDGAAPFAACELQFCEAARGSHGRSRRPVGGCRCMPAGTALTELQRLTQANDVPMALERRVDTTCTGTTGTGCWIRIFHRSRSYTERS